MSTLEGGRSVGRYRIERFLGEGAMGEVYLAEDPHIGRRLAIKTVRLAGRPEDVEDRKKRLLREARAAGRLLHPHVVTLFDAGETEGLLYLAFEYVEGTDLAVRMAAGPPLTLHEVLAVVGQAAEALDYAHRQGIVHRDIKPSNILLDAAGRVKVADFGIAKMAGQSTELTVAGSVLGSPQYLSPEQVRGEDLDGRSDLFSLGVVLYELLSGRRPFAGETITTLVYQILHKDPPPVAELRGGVPPRLERLLERMLAKDREERVASAAEVAAELAAVERELPDETLAAPAAADAQKQVPTRVLPRRTTLAAQVPPLPPLPAPPPAAPAAAAAGVAGTAGGSRARLWIALAAALVLATAAAGGGWYVLARRGAPAETAIAEATPGAPAEPEAAEAGADPAARDEAALSRPAPAPAAKTVVPSGPAAPSASPQVKAEREPAPQPAARPRDERPTAPPAAPPAAAADRRVPPTTTPQQRPPAPAGGAERPAPVVPAPQEEAPAPREETRPEPAAADQRIRSGLDLAFRVTPPDAHVLLDGTVIGRAQEWSGLKGNRTYTLPGPGSYLLKLRKPGMRDYRIAVEAAEAGGTTNVVARLQPLPSADVATQDLELHRVRQAVSLRGLPASATVAVDGRPVDRKGRRQEWLELSPGLHRITVSAPGFRQREIAVEVTGGAEREREKIDVRLEASGG